MHISEVTENKKQYLELLLLADEQEDMIDRYLGRGRMFILDDGGVKAECVVTDEGNGILELKNIAVKSDYHRCGYGKALIEHVADAFRDKYLTLQVGTGDVPSSLGFYGKCGFAVSGRVKNFFTDNYDHLMFEDGIQLVDMVYLTRSLNRLT